MSGRPRKGTGRSSRAGGGSGAAAAQGGASRAAPPKPSRHQGTLPSRTAEAQALVGKKVRKRFGSDRYDGKIVSYSGISNVWLRIKYKDGDAEDVSLSEAKELVVSRPARPSTNNNARRARGKSSLVGREVRKQFNTGWFAGVIERYTEDGWVEIRYEDGATEEVDIVEAKELLLPKKKIPAVPVRRLARDPQGLVGRRVRKQFKEGIFEGVIDDYLPRHNWWHVTYEDGDTEDVDLKRAMKLVLPLDGEQQPRNPQAQSQSEAETRDTSAGEGSLMPSASDALGPGCVVTEDGDMEDVDLEGAMAMVLPLDGEQQPRNPQAQSQSEAETLGTSADERSLVPSASDALGPGCVVTEARQDPSSGQLVVTSFSTKAIPTLGAMPPPDDAGRAEGGRLTSQNPRGVYRFGSGRVGVEGIRGEEATFPALNSTDVEMECGESSQTVHRGRGLDCVREGIGPGTSTVSHHAALEDVVGRRSSPAGKCLHQISRNRADNGRSGISQALAPNVTAVAGGRAVKGRKRDRVRFSLNSSAKYDSRPGHSRHGQMQPEALPVAQATVQLAGGHHETAVESQMLSPPMMPQGVHRTKRLRGKSNVGVPAHNPLRAEVTEAWMSAATHENSSVISQLGQHAGAETMASGQPAGLLMDANGVRDAVTAQASISRTQQERGKSQMQNAKSTAIQCNQCGTTETPQWRTGPAEMPVLCNACGVRLRKMMRKQDRLLLPPGVDAHKCCAKRGKQKSVSRKKARKMLTSEEIHALLGRKVQKQFPCGLYEGIIDEYIPRYDWVHITYEDGDMEDLFPEDAALLLVPIDGQKGVATPHEREVA